jgi:hydrogenase nickel incorporation protein HypA/HybF
MHELSLMEGLLEIIQESAETEGFGRVRRVVLEIGALAGVEVEALRFAFEAAAPGTVADGAALEIESPPGLGRCPTCGVGCRVGSRLEACPCCGDAPLTVTGGTELRIKALDVE